MTKEEKYAADQGQEETKESVLDFEEAKEMTVGQASRKKEELEAGVTDGDSVLDKYIKQHRAEIEAGKFDTTQKLQKLSEEEQAAAASSALADFIRETRESAEDGTVSPANTSTSETAAEREKLEQPADASASVSADTAKTAASAATAQSVASLSRSSRAASKGLDDIPVTPPSKISYGPAQEPVPEEELEIPSRPFYKRKAFLYSALALIGVAAVGTGLYFALGRSGGEPVASSSSSASSSRSSSSSSSSNSSSEALQSFNDLYASFFTDSSQTAIKNSSFGNLDQLQAALDKLNGTSEYNAAKAKYDALVKQISAIQSVNAQFNGAAITDGVLNREVRANSNASFSDAASTGNEKLDSLLKSAIEHGRSQQAPAPAQQTSPAPAAGSNNAGASNAAPANSSSGYGLSSAGVNLQRNLSRVPYNQAAIDDVSNPAWTFNPGILERVLQTSRERGYISGDNYILEKVNIINGNGYYNLFKPDGTYLFSINCKTGYFVGNGSGYADSLDY